MAILTAEDSVRYDQVRALLERASEKTGNDLWANEGTTLLGEVVERHELLNQISDPSLINRINDHYRRAIGETLRYRLGDPDAPTRKDAEEEIDYQLARIHDSLLASVSPEDAETLAVWLKTTVHEAIDRRFTKGLIFNFDEAVAILAAVEEKHSDILLNMSETSTDFAIAVIASQLNHPRYGADVIKAEYERSQAAFLDALRFDNTSLLAQAKLDRIENALKQELVRNVGPIGQALA